jgi:hypothetical protein
MIGVSRQKRWTENGFFFCHLATRERGAPGAERGGAERAHAGAPGVEAGPAWNGATRQTTGEERTLNLARSPANPHPFFFGLSRTPPPLFFLVFRALSSGLKSKNAPKRTTKNPPAPQRKTTRGAKRLGGGIRRRGLNRAATNQPYTQHKLRSADRARLALTSFGHTPGGIRLTAARGTRSMRERAR